jgi:hypothetical protein
MCRDRVMYSLARQSVRMQMQESVIKGVTQTAAIIKKQSHKRIQFGPTDPQRMGRRTKECLRPRKNTTLTRIGIGIE